MEVEMLYHIPKFIVMYLIKKILHFKKILTIFHLTSEGLNTRYCYMQCDFHPLWIVFLIVSVSKFIFFKYI